jgi:hypothetical protein
MPGIGLEQGRPGSAGFSPSHSGNASSLRTTGILSCNSAHSSIHVRRLLFRPTDEPPSFGWARRRLTPRLAIIGLKF